MRSAPLVVTVLLSVAVLTAQQNKPGLTGTVIAVNQQADTVTLIDLKTA